MEKTLFGHRGAKGEAPENTLDGFAYAQRVGVRAIELDVRLSADDQLVVIHDDVVDRTTGTTGKVRDFTAKQLGRLDARTTCPAWPNPVGIPTLSEVLEAHHDLDAFQLEIKSDTPERMDMVCAKLIAQMEHFQIAGRAVVTSFDPGALEIMQRRAPHLRRGFIGRYAGPDDLETASRLGCWNACIPLASSTKEMVHAAQARGLFVTGWLGNTLADLETLLDWGVDSITSDYPSLTLPFLRERGFGPASRGVVE
jgi:glycerophosphoryl diester phosphodiesterase